MVWNLVVVQPIGTRRHLALLCGNGCCVREVDMPVYPRSEQGEALRKERKGRGIVMRQAARVLGMGEADYSRLEHGSMVLPDAEYQRALGMLRTTDDTSLY